MKIRPTKSQVIKLVSEKAPEYIELFNEVKADAHGWLIIPKNLKKALYNVGARLKLTRCAR